MSDEEKKKADDAAELFSQLESDRKVITIMYSQIEGMMNITHDRMNAYEALGLLMTATDLLRHDISLIPAFDEDDLEFGGGEEPDDEV